MKAYSLNNHITLCPYWFTQWTTIVQTGETWTAMQKGTYMLADYTPIDLLQKSLTFTLLHEFTHNYDLMTVEYTLRKHPLEYLAHY